MSRISNLLSGIHELYSLDVVHGGNGGVGLRVLGKANEAKATAASGVAVLHNDLGGLAVCDFRSAMRYILPR